MWIQTMKRFGLRLGAVTAATTVALLFSLLTLVASRTGGATPAELLQASAWASALGVALSLPVVLTSAAARP